MSAQSALNQVSWSRYFYSVLFEKFFGFEKVKLAGGSVGLGICV